MSGFPPRHSIQLSERRLISDGRTQKLRLTRRPRLFTVGSNLAVRARHSRHRLPVNLPASPFGPFMVELFASPDLLEYPNLVIGPALTVASQRLPTPAYVERAAALLRPNPVGGFAAGDRRSPTSTHDGLATCRATRCFRIAPVPGLLVREFHRIERRDYSAGDHFSLTTGACGHVGQDYADEPPSSRTSHSHGIRLYRHGT